MKVRHAMALLAGLLAATAAEAKDWKTVTIALEGAYAPWNLTNPDGTLGGFEPALAKVLCERMKVECTLVASPWEGMLESLNAGRFDVVMDALAITEERKQSIAFSVPYAQSPAGFVTAKGGPLENLKGTGSTILLKEGQKNVPELEGLREALKGKTIGIMSATAYAAFIRDTFGDIATIREYKTGPERDIDLQTGRIDVGFDDAVYFMSAIDGSQGALAFTGPTIGGPIWGEGWALGLRKTDPELAAMFDKAIASTLADGTVKTLSTQYLKTDVTPAPSQ